MKIVTLVGRGGSGKTTTINIFIKKLLSYYEDKIIVKRTSLVGNSILDYLNKDLNPNECDRFVVIEIKGHTIGITTRGDSRWWLEEEFKHFDDCELCFCAARSNGETHEFLKSKSSGDGVIFYKHIRIDSFEIDVKSRYDQANENMTELLINEIRSLITGNPYKFN